MRTFPLRLLEGYRGFRGRAAQKGSYQHARLADEGWRILGYHLPDGGLGRVERDGDAYRFVPG